MQPSSTPRLPDERAVITKDIIDDIERDILNMGIAQYTYGTVLDCASGSGYGSYLLSKKSDITHERELIPERRWNRQPKD